jgi:hypothetical protein
MVGEERTRGQRDYLGNVDIMLLSVGNARCRSGSSHHKTKANRVSLVLWCYGTPLSWPVGVGIRKSGLIGRLLHSKFRSFPMMHDSPPQISQRLLAWDN